MAVLDTDAVPVAVDVQLSVLVLVAVAVRVDVDEPVEKEVPLTEASTEVVRDAD